MRKIDNPYGLPLGHFLGVLGMPGLTAYSALYRIGQPKAGETIFVSSAAGAVGQLVGQLAKREGLTVIGSVGSQAKLDFIINELGFDGGFNYKNEKPNDALDRLAPNGLDIYFENVGGEQLDAALAHMNVGGRIPVCGMVSCSCPFFFLFSRENRGADGPPRGLDLRLQHPGQAVWGQEPHSAHPEADPHGGVPGGDAQLWSGVLPGAPAECAEVASRR